MGSRLAFCGATRSLIASVSPDFQHESKLIPMAVIVRFVDADTIGKQTNEKRNRGDDPVPEAAPKTGRHCVRLFVLGV